MSVLVTGATGMFGSGVVTLLDRAGVEVLAMSRSEANAARMTRGNVTGVVADLDDPAPRSQNALSILRELQGWWACRTWASPRSSTS